MPELPDLEAIRGFLNQRIPGVRIEQVQALIPFVVRIAKSDFIAVMEGNSFGETSRRGKFLLFDMHSGHKFVVNAMLTGRFQWCRPADRKRAKTCIALTLANGWELRYVDERLMGKLYLVKEEGLSQIPQFAEMGPDALAPELTEEEFARRLSRFGGQIKNVLLNQKFVAGIGNAYSDEILHAAKIHPYRKRRTMSGEEAGRLYRAMRSVLESAVPLIVEGMGDELPLEEVRYFVKVHRRGGQACPVCGNRISEITAGQRVTSFCRTCQGEAG